LIRVTFKASRALIDPNLRHSHATIGHAVSTDLRRWTEVPDALVAAQAPGFDALAMWTGSVVRGDDGRWRMFYTGVDQAGAGLTQRIGVAVSEDLYVWRTEQPENMTEQAERPLKLKDESRGVDRCGPKWPGHRPETRIGRRLRSPNSVLLQRFPRVERVTGIEPALSAWEEFISSRVSVSCNDIGGLS
jgi:Glycosyl hydrolases family 32 N-terminal domain